MPSTCVRPGSVPVALSIIQPVPAGSSSSCTSRQRLNSLIDIVRQVPIPQVPGKASVKLPAIVAGD
ncbi:hypothetical protein ACC758_39760, partial [Rhizobium ruizarguesonis]